jgi:hypothetical protein
MVKGPTWRGKAREWLVRYLPLEIAATLTALAGGLGAAAVTDHPVVIAYAGALSENVGFYAVAVGREIRGAERPGVAIAIRRVMWEFGLAEALDSFVIRPFAMYVSAAVLGSVGLGIVVGKVLADLAFYAIAIVFYERLKARPPAP